MPAHVASDARKKIEGGYGAAGPAGLDGLVRPDDVRSNLRIDALASGKRDLDVFHDGILRSSTP